MLRHQYPFIPFGRLMMKRHHYPLIPCAPCSGKSKFDLVYIPAVYFNCKYFTSLYLIYARAIKDASSAFCLGKFPAGGNNSWIYREKLGTRLLSLVPSIFSVSPTKLMLWFLSQSCSRQNISPLEKTTFPFTKFLSDEKYPSGV